MRIEQEIFKDCKEIAIHLELARKASIKKNEELKTANISMKSYKDLLLEKLEDNFMAQCTMREKEFLNLKMIDGEKILDFLIRQFDISESIVPGLYTFQIDPLVVTITDEEINNNGFYYNSGRNEISKILYSIFTEKLGISIDEVFDRNEKFCLTFWSEAKSYVPF